MLSDSTSMNTVHVGPPTGNPDQINNAIESLFALGGGTIHIQPGKYLSRPIRLYSHVFLYLEVGASVRFVQDVNQYPIVQTRSSGIEVMGFSPQIYAYHAEHCGIIGPGTLDGQGESWWDEIKTRRMEGVKLPSTELEHYLAGLNDGYLKFGEKSPAYLFLRPPLIQFYGCNHVILRDFTARNSPFWNTHLVYCNNVKIQGVSFLNPYEAPNGDGLDLDSCSDVFVSHCLFDVGDDCLCLKSGRDEDGRRVNRPCERIIVSDCIMRKGHGGVVFGSETSGGIRDVVVSRCLFEGTDRGLRFKSRRGRGGVIENVICSDILMKRVWCGIVMNLSYYSSGGNTPEHIKDLTGRIPADEGTPGIRNIHLHDIHVTACSSAAAYIHGLPESLICGLNFANILVEMHRDANANDPAMSEMARGMRMAGWVMRFVRDVTMDRIRVLNQEGDTLIVADSSRVKSDYVKQVVNEH